MQEAELSLERTIEIRFIAAMFRYRPWRERRSIYRGLRSKRHPDRAEQAAAQLVQILVSNRGELAKFASKELGTEIRHWEVPAHGSDLDRRSAIIRAWFHRNLKFQRGKFSLPDAGI